MNTRQQTERDLKKEKRKHGTIERMCQVLLLPFFFFCPLSVYRILVHYIPFGFFRRL